jgi:NADH dehydrogenase [ubiquinone] 1 alpha subcomplex assembly factor 2
MRRIVQYPASTHYSDIKISPQWHQWLRHTRPDPPSITEQSQDIIRQQNLKILAAEADARWAAKPSLLDSPEVRGKPLPALEPSHLHRQTASTGRENRAGARDAIGVESERDAKRTDIPAKSVEMREHNGKSPDDDDPEQDLTKRSAHETWPRAQKDQDDPWKQARGSEKWQPATWHGNVAVRR